MVVVVFGFCKNISSTNNYLLNALCGLERRNCTIFKLLIIYSPPLSGNTVNF